MTQSWTDDRLDDLNQRMEAGFKRVDDDVRELRSEMNARFDRVDARFEHMEAKFDAKFERMEAKFDGKFDRLDAKFDAKFDALQRTLLQVGGGMAAAFGAALIGLIATQL